MSENKVFMSIRNGTLGANVHSFKPDDFSPFLPFLFYRFFKTTDEKSDVLNKEELDAIRALLIRCPDGNEILNLFKLDSDQLHAQFTNVHKGQPHQFNQPFASMPTDKRVIFVGSLLIEKAKNPSLTTDSFEPFDVENYQKEIVWIISTLCICIPQYFNVVELSTVLLSYTYGVQILKGVLLNHPALLDQVLARILSLDVAEGSENLFMRRCKESIFAILELDQTQVERFLKVSLEQPTKLRICVDILCGNLVDDQLFVCTLISHLMSSNGIFCQFLVKNVNKEFMTKIRDRFNAILQTEMPSEFKERVVLLMAVLSNYNFLRASAETTHLWVRFLTDQTSADNLRLVKMVLAVILACPNLLPANQQAFRDQFVEEQLTEFFCWIKEKTELDNSNEYGPLNRFMLLTAIHMQTNNGAELSKLLSDELSFDVGDTLRKHTTVKTLFLRHATPEHVVARKAALLGVSKNLDANFAGYLPVHCVNYLLSARTFSKNQIMIQDWIKRQLRECQVPIHPFMVHVLENFAASCFPTAEDSNYNEQIDEEFFWELFTTDLFSDDKILASKVLSLFYLLTFTRRLDTSPTIVGVGTKKAPKAYSDKLWAEIPIRYILSVTDARPKDFEMIRVDLLTPVWIMPHMLPTLDASVDRTEDELAAKSMTIFKSIPKAMFSEALDGIQSDFERFTLLVNHLQAAPIQEHYLHYETIIKAMLISLDDQICPMHVTLQLAKIWRRLTNLIPRKLFEQTLQLWLNTPNAATQGPIEINNSVLLNEVPSIIFRVDNRVFKSPPHFELLMQILSFYLDAIKNYNNVRLMKIAATQEPKGDVDEKNLLIKSYTGGQHLLVVQYLLDICNGDKETNQHLEEIRDIACSQIHQMFVSDLALPKLVHFCMYPVNLIPMVVEKVPSMHVLITAIAELIVPGHLGRRIFGINLVAELAQKYTVPSALSAVEFIENSLETLLEATVDETTIVLFYNIADALRKFIGFGSPHKEFVESMLKRVRNIARARCALYRSEAAVIVSPERQLISKIDAII